VIDALEGREVGVVDLPGAFMQAEMDELMHMKVTGRMADLMSELAPTKYSPFLTRERGESVPFVRLAKALYRPLHGTTLFWIKLTKKLQEYDVEFSNKTVSGR
jgi:hypothetical protein